MCIYTLVKLVTLIMEENTQTKYFTPTLIVGTVSQIFGIAVAYVMLYIYSVNNNTLPGFTGTDLSILFAFIAIMTTVGAFLSIGEMEYNRHHRNENGNRTPSI